MSNHFQAYKSIDKFICLIVATLAVISILMIGSATIESGFFSRSAIIQIVAYAIGTLAIVLTLRFNYSIFSSFGVILYVISIALLLSVYIPGLGTEIYGSRAWLDLKFTTFQPSEIVKILFILIMADYLNKHKDDLYNLTNLLKAVLIAAPIILMVLKEDMGSALVFVAIWIAMIFFAGADLKAFAKLFALGLAMLPVGYIFLADYQKDRIEAFLHPDNLSLPGNWQVWQSKVAIGSGGLFGKGLFHGTQKSLDYIPVQTSDFIFSVIGEELGFVGGLAVIILYAALLIRMVHILHEALDFYGALIVSGVIGMIAFQVFENISMTMGIMPVTGITLPFMSYGGSSIIASMLGIALVLNIGANSKKITF